MRKPSLRVGALLGGLISLPLIAVSFLGEQVAGLPFIPFDLFDWLARALPGDIVTIGIDSIVKTIHVLNLGPTSPTAKRIEQLMGLAMVVAGGAVLGTLIAWVRRRSTRSGWEIGAMVGFVAFVLLAAIELDLGLGGSAPVALLGLALLVTGWGAVLGNLLELQTKPVANEVHASRRAALLKIAGGSIGVALGAWGLGRLLESQVRATGSRPTPRELADSHAGAKRHSAALGNASRHAHSKPLSYSRCLTHANTPGDGDRYNARAC